MAEDKRSHPSSRLPDSPVPEEVGSDGMAWRYGFYGLGYQAYVSLRSDDNGTTFNRR